MTAPAFGVTDTLVLGAGWEPQSSSTADAGTRATATGDDGDIVAQTVHNLIESGTVSYIYTGAETNFPAAFVASSCDVGDIMDGATLQITGWSIDYSPCAAGQRPVCTFTFRDGRTAAYATPFVYVSALGAALPTYVVANVVVPEILVAVTGSAEIQSASCSLTAQLGEDLDKDGEFETSQIYQGEETVNTQWVGAPTSVTSAGWVETATVAPNTGPNATNTGYTTASYTYVRGVTRT